MEAYAIGLCNGWSIENLKNSDKDIKLDKVKFELPFAQYEFYEDKLNWIYDPFKIKDEHIEACENIEAFKKTASFKVLLLKSEWINVDEFQGTFIDALKYIQKKFNH